MKKIILAALASLCTLSSCMEEITVPEAVSADLYTEIEQNDQTRTVMDEDNKILWSEGDQVAAFMQAPESQKYQIKDEYVGKSYGHFSQVSPASSNEMGTSSEWDHNVIYYPYSSTVQCERLESDYNLSIVFPSEQTYAPESFGHGTFPMVAVSTTTNFAFRNVGGGMKLQFKGSSTITSIKVQGNNNEKLSGKARVTAYADGTVPSIEFASDASTSVTLNCGDGVQLNENTVTEFILSLPPVVFTQGFTVTVTTSDGITKTIETSKKNNVLRSSILAMPEIEIANQSQSQIPNNEIHYTAEEKIEFNSSNFEQEVVSHEFSSETLQGIIIFDKDVTSIGDKAFDSCKSLMTIILPDSVTSIGDYAFNSCNYLYSITLPSNLRSIGEYAFKNCEYLYNVTIPDSVTSIGHFAFSYCKSLQSITIPNGVSSIGVGTFSLCSSLQSITLPSNLASIGNGAFNGCDSLQSITIPDGVTSIGDSAFFGCDSLQSITIPDSVTSIGNSAFSRCNSLLSITIPNSVNSIGDNVFEYCESLQSIIIPDNVTSIGKYAFYYCESLQSITIPDSVTSIGNYAFHWCTSLQSITIPDSVTSIGMSAFNGCESLQSITIPDSVTSIGNYAFQYCESLQSITIPDSVTSIGENAFYYCKSLQSITIPASLTSIGSYAFYNCESLQSIIIPDSVTSIGERAFYYCKSLQSITIPASLTSIGSYAFYGCRSLQSITIPANLASYANIFSDIYTSIESIYFKSTGPFLKMAEIIKNNRTRFIALKVIYVPRGSENTYKSHPAWASYADLFQGYDY